MLRQIKQAWFPSSFFHLFMIHFLMEITTGSSTAWCCVFSRCAKSTCVSKTIGYGVPITHEGVTLIGCTVYNAKRDGLLSVNTIYWLSGACAHSTGCEERCSSLSLVDWNTEQGRGQDIDEFDENEICWSYICYMKTGRRKAGGLVAIYECDEWWTRRGRGGWDEK